MKIYKAVLNVSGCEQPVTMPKDSVVLNVQIQNGNPVVWFRFDDQNPKQEAKRRFIFDGTGYGFDHGGVYIGTVQINNLVLHLHDLGWY